MFTKMFYFLKAESFYKSNLVCTNLKLHNRYCQMLGLPNAKHCIRTITYKSRLTQKKLHKKNNAIFSIYGKNGINPWHFFFNSHLGLSRSLRPKEADFEAEK